MNKETLQRLFELVSQLKPYEWYQFKAYVDARYEVKKADTPMPSVKELQNYSSFDFPSIRNQQLECGKD